MWNQGWNYAFNQTSVSPDHHCRQLTSYELFNALHLSISQPLSLLNMFDGIYLVYCNGGLHLW